MVVLDQSNVRPASSRTDARCSWVQIVIFIVALVLFFVPLVASASFGFSLPGQPFTLDSLALVGRDSAFLPGLLASIQLAILATLCSLALLVPTLLWLHIRAPRLLPVAEWLSVVPYVIPAIALVGGASLFFRAVAVLPTQVVCSVA